MPDGSFVVNATKGGPSHYLRLPRERLRGFRREDIIEARVERASAPGKEIRLYTCAAYVDPHLTIFHLKPSARELFRVLSLKRFDMIDFLRDFNSHRPRIFRNVRVSYSDGEIILRVDHLAAVIKNPKLSARGRGAILEGRIIDGTNRGSIRVSRELESFSLHFGDYSTNHPRIVHMKAKETYIQVGYVVSSHESDYRTRRIPALVLEPANVKFENQAKSRFTEIDCSNMTKKEIRAWIDTEGNIHSRSMGGKSGPAIRVVQKHREPLDVFARSVGKIGVSCRVKRDKRGLFIALITSTEGVAKVIKAVGPFRTPQKREQVRQFIERLRAPRRERRRVIERSRALLGE